MRPIKLTLQAFGSYVQKTEIDFDRLGSSGIYLITGKTGSGKTMIFDGIVYALFGTSSGGKRDKELRSKAAPEGLPMEVELTFAYGGDNYTVRRGIGYYTKRGIYKSEEAVQELTLPDGSSIEGSAINKKIMALLGVNANQFGQIAMLAQGSFRQLIDCDTKARSAILKTIFHTDRYEKLQEALKDHCNTADKNYTLKKGELDRAINGIRIPEVPPEEFADCSGLAALGVLPNQKDGTITELTYEKALDLVKAVLEVDGNSKARYEIRQQEVSKQLEVVNKDIGAATAYEGAKKQLLDCQKNAPLLTEKAARCQQRFQEAEQLRPEWEKARDSAAALQEQVKQHDRLNEVLTNCEQIQKECIELEKKQEKANLAVQEFQKQLEQLRQERETLRDSAVEAENLKGQLADCQKSGKSVTAALKKLDDLDKAYKSLEDAQANYAQAAKEAQCVAHEFAERQTAFLDAQAGILASGLQEGKPCPVCGSREHPNPAPRPTTAPSQQEVEELKYKCERFDQERVQASSAAAECKGVFESNVQDFKASWQEVCPDLPLDDGDPRYQAQRRPLEERQRELRATYVKLERKRVDAESRAKRYNELEKELIPRKEKDKEDQEGALHSIQEVLRNRQARLEATRINSEQARQALTFTSKAETLAAIAAYAKRADEINVALEQTRNDLQNAKSELLNNGDKMASLTEQLREQPEHSLDDLRRDAQRLNDELNDISSQREAVNNRISENTRARNSLSAGIGELESLGRTKQVVQELYDVARGQIAGSAKQNLENYVLGYYLDLIVAHANERYRTMTDGRYRLERSKIAGNNRSQSGLDLDVFDNFDGQARSISSLSGGESFLAALSLALGLSDEVQASAGGIQLDAMFVDEGFGSLDREALNIAVNALKKLPEGRRMVGIISHVADLESMIDNKVRVTHTQEKGSAVAIEVG